MRWMILYALLLMGVMECHAGEDLGNKVFLFPKQSSTAHVILKPEAKTSLGKLTVCLRSYTELTRNYSLFSLAMSGENQHNAFLILVRPPNVCSVYVDQIHNSIKTDPEALDWKHTCVTWDSDTGIIQLWINGKLYPRRVSKKGFAIKPEISIILGQEQDSFGGGFDLNQCFVGEIGDVHMWDYVLTPNDIQKVVTNDQTGNVINWRSLHFEIKGSVLIQPKLQCKYPGYASSLYSQC
ncbi:C-reactive protein-like [Hyla sarda]|uniref:C-reactive protein-like n=1 Tax=Hyla sarda TaxID=327740 RepID=UPI0024C40AB6|nr:C-reactive protein-like [Hyla sarda]